MQSPLLYAAGFSFITCGSERASFTGQMQFWLQMGRLSASLYCLNVKSRMLLLPFSINSIPIKSLEDDFKYLTLLHKYKESGPKAGCVVQHNI